MGHRSARPVSGFSRAPSALAILFALVLTTGCSDPLGSSDGGTTPTPTPIPPTPVVVFPYPQTSGSLALSPDDRTLYVANGCIPHVSYLHVGYGALTKRGEIPAGSEPTSVAIDPRGQYVYVTNRGTVPGTVSVLSVACKCRASDIEVGTEPTGCVLTPTGAFLFVANSMSNTISVIRTATRSVVATIPLPDGYFPFALACTNDGDTDDSDETVYVTQFLAQLRAGSYPTQDYGDTDTGRVGKVNAIDVRSGSDAQVRATIELPDLDTGFTADRTPFGGTAADPTRAFPNLLTSIVLRNGRAHVISSGTSPEPPIRYDANQQALLTTVDLATGTATVTRSYNLNRVAISDHQPAASTTQGLFFNVPWGIGFAPGKNVGYLLSAGSDLAVRCSVDATGNVTIAGFSGPRASSAGIVRVPVGKNPRSIVFDSTGSFAFVHNYISRTVSAIQVSDDTVTAQEPSADRPLSGSLADAIHRGETLFNTSVGTSTVDGSVRRMSYNGFSSCFGCHPFGWTDTTVWSFPSGPRKTPSLAGMFARTDASDQKVPTWSAICDEVADFELLVRTVSAAVDPADNQPGQGLFVGIPTTAIQPLVPLPNSGRNVDWNDLESYVRFGLRSPISPLENSTDPDIPSGRSLFASAGCNRCHGGAKWTSSRLVHVPPPTFNPTGTVSVTAQGELVAQLRQVDTYSPLELSSAAGAALGRAGLNPPSLLGCWAFPPYFHHGRAVTFEEMMTLQFVPGGKTHRDAGVAGRLDSVSDRLKLFRFLRSLDDSTVPF